jgi:hypothetical protein
MTDNLLAVRAALVTIRQASCRSLVSCSAELLEANIAIAEALLSRNKSTREPQSHPANEVEDGETFAAKSTGDIVILNDAPAHSPSKSDAPKALEKYKTWLSRPEIALVNLAQYWLQTRTMASEYRGGRDDLPIILRKAMVSSSPAVFALLRKSVSKRRLVRW